MPENRIRLMAAMDAMNQRYGRGTLKLASAGTPRAIKLWAMRQERKTTAYTTDWTGLLSVHLDA
jgi:DNA polymerase V